MPELPDVEAYRRHLAETSLNRTVDHVTVRDDRLLNMAPSTLRRRLTGACFRSARRRGKWLLAEMGGNGWGWLVLHFGMTGKLWAFDDDGAEPDYSQIRFDFEDGGHLSYINRRRWGRLLLVDHPADLAEDRDLGPDALDEALNAEDFAAIFEQSRATIKSALMDQERIAGIGNIYADEILFQTGVHPQAEAQALDRETLKGMFHAMRQVFNRAADAGAGYEGFKDDLPGDWLLPVRSKGAPCPECGRGVAQIEVSGRRTNFCPHCQTEGAP